MNSNRIITSLSVLAMTALAACGPQGLPLSNAPVAAPGLSAQTATTSRTLPQIAVKYKSGAIGAQSLNVARSIGAQKVGTVGTASAGIDVLQVPAGQNANAVAAQLSKNPAVAFAEPIFTVPFPQAIREGDDNNVSEPAAFPNDPMFGRQYSHQVAHSPQAWAVNKGSRKILIGIVDSGVDITHPDLKGKIAGVFNGADNNKDVKDHVGHGTHVAGIAAAMTHNKLGVAGVAPECGILAAKVASGSSGSPSTAGIANGIRWAADNGASVINLSLGGKRQSMLITDAVNYALSKNIVVVAAAGNDGREVKNYPGAVPGVIAVASTDSSNRRSSFSTMGDWVSVAAPGSSILSTFPLNSNMIGQKEYGSISGTSMATPFVAGLAALLRTKYPNMSVADVKRVLELSAEDLGAPGHDKEFGFGRVNVGKAVINAEELLASVRR